MPDDKRIIVSMPQNTLKQLDRYAKDEFKGNRTMAIYHIVKRFLEERHYAIE